MADTSKPEDQMSGGQDLPSSTEEKTPEDIVTKKENESKKDGSGVSTTSKIQSLRNNKKSAKTRLTKTKNQLSDLLESNTLNGALPSKNAVQRAINKIKTESSLIEKIVASLKEAYALNEIAEADKILESLDKEADEIMVSVDEIIEKAEKHVQERLDKGEEESILLSSKSQTNDDNISLASSCVKQKQLEAKQASERLSQVEEEQKQKELELERITAEVQLAKQRAEEARKVAALNQLRADVAEQGTGLHNKDDTSLGISRSPDLAYEKNAYGPGQYHGRLVQRNFPVKLKGVDLPKFSGEDKADYEPWKAAFMSIVDGMDIPVGEKVLRLQSSLAGKALALVKDLGYSVNAYERAKEKLKRKYGGERRLQIKHLTALRDWQKVRPRNLEDMEKFQGILERVWIALKDCRPGQELQGHNLNLTAKEKLSEEDVQAYKHWLINPSLEDNFESLIEWVEICVQIMEEAREETSGFERRKSDGPEGRRNGFRGNRVCGRTFTTKSKPRGCTVDTCKQNHPPWVCKAFKELPVMKRKELIGNTNRCYRCLAAGHHSKECPNVKRCGVEGCLSSNHSSYLHEKTPHHLTDRTQGQLHVDASPFRPEEQPNPERRSVQATGVSTSDPAPVNPNSQEQTHNTSHVEHVSLIILPALISNGNKELRVNVMLDPCSTSSYISEEATEELELHGQGLNLTIAGTGGAEVKTRSHRVELTVTNLDGTFSSPLQAHALENIAGDMLAIRWSELKDKWPHLRQVPFENVSRRRQIDIMIGSDHPVFHHVLKETCGDQQNDPIARLTNLGWVCFGPTLAQHSFPLHTH